jgi:molybdopterin-guanine dinucleotide biosynthesis protein A
MNAAAIYGLVLSGGASRRMQRDKAALEYQGQPQLQRAYELLQAHCAQVFVSVRADQQQETLRSRWPQIVDQQSDVGPLAGIAAAQLKHPDVAWLVIACDLPLLTGHAIKLLVERRDATGLATAYRNPYDQQPEPLCAVWEPASAPLVQAALSSGERSPRTLLQNWPILLLDSAEAYALSNVNTPDEHQQAHTQLMDHTIELQLQYFAILREQAGKRSETLQTNAATPAQLYAELKQRYGFTLAITQLKVAINNEFCDWQQPLKAADVVTFIPPVAGG